MENNDYDNEFEDAVEDVAVVSKVNVKIPPFWKTHPELWFRQVESQFFTANIRTDKAKFHTVVAAIESEILMQVSDIIVNQPVENMYQCLKEKLIQRYAESEQQRLKKLLQEIQLGDRKPSELLREMRQLAGNTVSEELMKSIWTQHLPEQMRMILSTNDANLDKLSKMADKISEVTSSFNFSKNCSAIGQTNDRTSRLEKQISDLSNQVAMLTTIYRNRSDSSQRSNSKSQNRDKSSSRSNTFCYYHRKFGVKALKCRDPCTFSVTENLKANR